PFSTDHAEAAYTFYQLETHVEDDSMRIGLPIAAGSGYAGATKAFVRLGPPVAKMRVRLSGERVGEWPVVLPPNDFESGGVMYVVEKSKVNRRAPKIMPDADTRMYAVDAEYV